MAKRYALRGLGGRSVGSFQHGSRRGSPLRRAASAAVEPLERRVLLSVNLGYSGTTFSGTPGTLAAYGSIPAISFDGPTGCGTVTATMNSLPENDPTLTFQLLTFGIWQSNTITITVNAATTGATLFTSSYTLGSSGTIGGTPFSYPQSFPQPGSAGNNSAAYTGALYTEPDPTAAPGTTLNAALYTFTIPVLATPTGGIVLIVAGPSPTPTPTPTPTPPTFGVPTTPVPVGIPTSPTPVGISVETNSEPGGCNCTEDGVDMDDGSDSTDSSGGDGSSSMDTSVQTGDGVTTGDSALATETKNVGGTSSVLNAQPSLAQIGPNTIMLVQGPQQELFFDQSASGQPYVERYGGTDSLTYSSGTGDFTFADSSGDQTVFYGFGAGPLSGKASNETSPGGVATGFDYDSPAPAALSSVSGGSLSATTYYASVTYVGTSGETLAGPTSSISVASGHLLTVASPPSIPGYTGYNVYVGTSSGTMPQQNGGTPISLGTAWTEAASGLCGCGAALPASGIGQLSQIFTSSTSGTVTTEQSFLYSYVPAGDPNAGDLRNVVLRRKVFDTSLSQYDYNTPYTPVQQDISTYYASGSSYGNLGDLQTFTTEDVGPVVLGASGCGALSAGGSVPVGANFYQVSAVLATGETSPSNEFEVTTSSGTQTVNLSWNSVSGATSYDIYRATGSSAIEQLLATTSATGYSDSSAATPSGAARTIDTTYDRYYTTGAEQLEYVVGPESYARLAASMSTGTPLTATNMQLAPYADQAYTYNSDNQVSQQVVQGEGTITYAYYHNGGAVPSNDAGTAISPYNVWTNETAESMPDGTVNTDFFNAFGETMLAATTDGITGLSQGTFTEFNNSGQPILVAQPSAVLLPASLATLEQYPDLLNNTGSYGTSPSYHYLSNTTGQITLTNYYSPTTPTPTGTGSGTPSTGVSGASGAPNYVENTYIEQGQSPINAAAEQESFTYYSLTAGGATVYPIATDTTYGSTGGGDARVTSNFYTWYSSSTQMETQTVVAPPIGSSQNGPGTALTDGDITSTFFDTFGNSEWVLSGNGNVSYTGYDTATGSPIETITSVNYSDLTTAQQTSFGLTGWSHPSGLNLVTTMVVDSQGRTTKLTDPDGDVDYTVFDDPDHEQRVYDGFNSGATTGPIQISETYYPAPNASSGQQTLYTETITSSATPHLTGGVPDGTEALTSANIQSLTRSLTNADAQTTELDSYFSLAGVTYSDATAQLGSSSNTTSSGNYSATLYSFDVAGREDRVQDPAGTITRTVFNGMGNPISKWVGTDDTPGSGNWSPANNTSPSNMVDVEDDFYDTQTAPVPATTGTTSGGSLSATTDYVRVTYITPSGETAGSLEVSQAVAASHLLTVTSPAAANNATAYNVYVSTASGAETLQNSTPISIATNWTEPTSGLVAGAAVPVNGAGGDDNLTEVVDHPGAGQPDRTTLNWFDWEDRLVGTKQGAQGSEDSSTYRPLTYNVLDNAGEATTVETFDGDTIFLSIPTSGANAGVPQPPSSTLEAKTVSSYDDQGRVYQSAVTDVGSPSPTPTLVTNSYFDHDGNLIATYAPGGLVSKNSYDSADRVTAVYQTDGGAVNNGGTQLTGFSNAGSVANDVVLSEADDTYDADGNVTETVNKDRFNTDAGSATGALGSPTSGIGARDSYTVNWYDLAGRTSATADYGTNGGVAISAPPASPPGNSAVSGTASAGSTTTLTDSSLTAPSGTYIGYQVSIPTDSSYLGTVTGYVQSSHTLTFTPAAGASPSGDAYTLTPVALPTTYGYLADNVQTVTLAGATGGTFTLTFNGHTTGSIAYNALASAVESDLAGLTGVGSGNVAVTTVVHGTSVGPYVIRFMGSLAGTSQSAITATSSLTGSSPTISAVVSIPGGDAGMVQATTDPRGVVALSDYNLLGQTVTTIAGFSSGVPTNDTDQTTAFAYSGNGDQTSQVAIMPAGTNSQATDYVYGVTIGGGSAVDSNDLLGATEYPDTSTGVASSASGYESSQTYDADGDTVASTDRNSTTHTMAYNVLGQETSDTATTLGAGVDGTVRRRGFTYSSLGSIYQATTYSDTAGTTVLTQDQFVYNGLDQETQEYQSNSGAVVTSGPTPTPSVQYAYAGPGSGQNYSRQVSMTYPNGRQIDTQYNSALDSAISRPDAVADDSASGVPLASDSYLGLSTIVQQLDGNNVGLSYLQQAGDASAITSGTQYAGDQYTGLDRFGQVIDQNWVLNPTPATPTPTPAPVSTDRTQLAYDRAGDVLYSNNLLNSTESELYHASSTSAGDNNSAYDPLGRETAFLRGTLSSSGNNPSTGSGLDTVANAAINTAANSDQTWSLDALGNWSSSAAGSGTGTATAPTLTSTSRTNNSQNEVTADGSATPGYDNNGDTTTDQNGDLYSYDAWGHIVTDINPTTGHEATYTTDALGNRVAEQDGAGTTSAPVLIVDNGSIQRSMVDSLTVVFPGAVTLSAGAFTLYNTTTSSSESVSWSNPSSDGKTWLIAFTGGGIVDGSLPNGVYNLTLTAADVSGITLGSNVIWAFHRLFGDINGDGTVNGADVAIFEEDYSSIHYGPTYDPAFDAFGNGRDFNNDYSGILADYGTTYAYSPSGSIYAGPSTTPPVGSTDVSSWSVGQNDMYYSGSNVIEEDQAGASGAWRQEVWGLGYVNSLIEQDTATAVDSGGVLPTSHFLQYALDTSFNGTGELVTANSGSYDGVAIQNNGESVVAGVTGSDLTITRYAISGALDPTFGTAGVVTISETSPSFAKLALDSSGNIDVAVNSGSNVEVYQLSSSGSTNWSTALTFATGVVPQGIALEPSGDIIVAGDSSGGAGIYLAGLHPSTGAIDTGFGSSGYVNAPLSGNPSGLSVALDSSGKILVAGSDGGDFSVVRFTSSGGLDTSFNSTGEATVNLGGTDTAYAVAPGPAGTIVAAGVSVQSGSNDAALIRLTSSGSLDTTYNSTGKIVGSSGSGTIRAILVQTNGEVLAGGDASSGTAQKVWMFTPAGAADTAFASGGTLTANSGATVYGWAVASGPTQRIVVAGSYGGDEALAAFAPASLRLYAEQSANYNVTSVADPYGNVVQRYLYDSYGNMTVLSAAWTPQSDLFGTQVGFQGMWLDVASGLYHTPNRDYSAALGRWMEQDPAGYTDGGSLYQFVGSAPIALLDPAGLQTTQPTTQAVAPPISKAKFLRTYGQGDEKETLAALDTSLLANSTAFETAGAYARAVENSHYQSKHITFPIVTHPGLSGEQGEKSAAYVDAAGAAYPAGTYAAGYDLILMTWEICTKGTGPGRLTATETQKVTTTNADGKEQVLLPVKTNQPTELLFGQTWYVAPLKKRDGEYTDMLIYVDSPAADAQLQAPRGGGVYSESDVLSQTVEVKGSDGSVLDTRQFAVDLDIDSAGKLDGTDHPLNPGTGPSSKPSNRPAGP